MNILQNLAKMAPSIICSQYPTKVFLEQLVISCFFEVHFIYVLNFASTFRQIFRHDDLNLVLGTKHDHIISLRRLFISSQAGSFYFNL